jgi:predicted O-methyltransferase YrrM
MIDIKNLWDNSLKYNIEQKPEEILPLIKFLLKENKLEYGLEIGSNYGGSTYAFASIFKNFLSIDIKHHQNFDKLKSEFPNYDYIISDSGVVDTYNLIKAMNIKFDFIFIDGDHGYDAVKKDYIIYKEFIKDGGFIAFHDIKGDKDSAKFWMEIKDDYESYQFFATYRDDSYNHDDEFHKIMNDFDYGSWGGIGVIKNQKILVFSHNYLIGDWKTIVKEQVDMLIEHELYDRSDHIYYCVFSKENEEYYNFIDIIKCRDYLNKINIVRHKENAHELYTLRLLKKISSQYNNSYVLYYHTKGLTSIENHRDENIYEDVMYENVMSWRKCLEYFNIERWKHCIKTLKDNHISGALYITNGQYYKNYFAGNFWWARTDYIKQLKDISTDVDNRMSNELWIGTNPHRWYSFYSKGWESVYKTYFDPLDYKK